MSLIYNYDPNRCAWQRHHGPERRTSTIEQQVHDSSKMNDRRNVEQATKVSSSAAASRCMKTAAAAAAQQPRQHQQQDGSGRQQQEKRAVHESVHGAWMEQEGKREDSQSEEVRVGPWHGTYAAIKQKRSAPAAIVEERTEGW